MFGDLDAIVFDVETAENPDVVGWDTAKLSIGVAVVWESRSGRFKFYGPNDGDKLRRRIMEAEIVSGFNIVDFDLPVVFGFSRGEWQASAAFVELRAKAVLFDLFRIARGGLGLTLSGPCGKGLGLQEIAIRTLGHTANGGKSGHGSEAPGMFQRGETHDLAGYCLDDVTIERDVLIHAIKFGYMITGQGVSRVARGVRADPILSVDVSSSIVPADLDRWLVRVGRPIADNAGRSEEFTR